MMSCLFRFYVAALLFTLSSTSWAQVIRWEITAEISPPGTIENQDRSYSGGFDFDTVTGSIFNVSIMTTGTTGAVCFLCFDYSGADAEVLSDGASFTKRVDSVPPAYRINFLHIIGFDVSQPGTFSNLNLIEEAYFNAGTGDPVDDTFVSDFCAECATLTGTLVPIPEPETYAMLLAGIGLLGFRTRRKQATMTRCG